MNTCAPLTTTLELDHVLMKTDHPPTRLCLTTASAGWPQPQSVPQAETAVLKPVLETPTTGLRAEIAVQTLVPVRAIGLECMGGYDV